ncbi:hypothetical protein OUZ56_015689 [Daphnia magna]|uniref:C1q domain-containing protein n=2 Tax=Daphnia magna TaxID=35525 RepID=A0ABR0ANG4_9CRUS|nr:hypothetical protein OUZ56_015689 [Daphnia magna]
MKNLVVALFFVLSCVVSAQYLTRWGYDPYAYLTPTHGVSEAIEARTPHKSNRMFGSLVNRFILENQDSRIENLEIEIQKLKACTCTVPTITMASKIPTSCRDLQLMGHTKNGLYSVMGSKQVETVYCDFAKPFGAQDFQVLIGSVGVKSVVTNFYVQKNTKFSRRNTPIPFEVETVNNGRAMDLASGKFTAPVKGTYFFTFAGHASFPSSFTRVEILSISFYRNGNKVGTAEVGEFHSDNNQLCPLNFQTSQNLQAGDQVWLQIETVSSGVELYDDSRHLTHFSGFLLEEDFS